MLNDKPLVFDKPSFFRFATCLWSYDASLTLIGVICSEVGGTYVLGATNFGNNDTMLSLSCEVRAWC
jgi:hypothetical protein